MMIVFPFQISISKDEHRSVSKWSFVLQWFKRPYSLHCLSVELNFRLFVTELSVVAYILKETLKSISIGPTSAMSLSLKKHTVKAAV